MNITPIFDFKPAKLYTAKGDITKHWYAYFFVRDPLTGKMKMFQRTAQINYIKNYKKRLSEGKMLVEEINKLLREGWSPISNNSKVLDLKSVLLEMAEIKKPSLRKRSVEAYNYALSVFFAWQEKHNLQFIYPDQFDNRLCHAFADYLIKDKKFSGRNFNNHKTLLSALFNMMEEREIIVKNPFKKIKSFIKSPGKNTPFTDEIKQQLIDEMILKNYRLYLFTQFVYYCFIRPAELLRVRVGDIDLHKKQISLSGSQTKNKKAGFIVIPDAFISIVRSMNLELLPKDYFIFGIAKREILIPSPKSLSRNTATNTFNILRKGLNFGSEITLYGWKDTGVCNAYKAGIPLYRIMMQCRHSSLSQTQIYLNSLGLETNIEFAEKMK